MSVTIAVAETPLVRFLLGRADDALILGHRLSEWTGRAPILEEELALANMALDLIGQARALYSMAAEAEGGGHDEDAYAYLRDDAQFRNLLIVEQPRGDFADTMVRQALYAIYAKLFWQAASRSTHPPLAGFAAKTAKEMAYHVRHASTWVIRLGDGTEASRARAQVALERLAPYVEEMFEPEDDSLTGIVPAVPELREDWEREVRSLLGEARLNLPDVVFSQRGGRAGRHGEALGHLLAVFQHLHRSHPGATW
ncbi:MAG: phenylacetate-CoA oxygenase subunit PaaC [Rhodospirillales bacterium]|nr:phenylacetate-CoA oxygenase subunit PaaC [Rhodospirillales bacterium]